MWGNYDALCSKKEVKCCNFIKFPPVFIANYNKFARKTQFLKNWLMEKKCDTKIGSAVNFLLINIDGNLAGCDRNLMRTWGLQKVQNLTSILKNFKI